MPTQAARESSVEKRSVVCACARLPHFADRLTHRLIQVGDTTALTSHWQAFLTIAIMHVLRAAPQLEYKRVTHAAR